MLKSPWHFHIQLSVISHTSQTGLRSSCYIWLKCHSLPGNASACATENSSGAGRGLSRFSLSETSASREDHAMLNVKTLSMSFEKSYFCKTVTVNPFANCNTPIKRFYLGHCINHSSEFKGSNSRMKSV